MNRNIVLILLALLLTVSTRAQKHISREYNNVSISDALNGLAEQQTDYAIMFLYNELEDFRITTTIRRKTLPDAIQQMIGFYPIRMTVDTSDPEDMKIFVECTHKTDRRLTGTIIDEQGQPVAYANVAILNPVDSTLLGSGVSNESGYFVVPTEAHRVILKCSFVGYRTYYRSCEVGHIGTIQMKPAEYTINGVTVEGTRIMNYVDKSIHTFSVEQISQARNIRDLLEHVKDLKIDPVTNKIKRMDGGSVKILINGIASSDIDLKGIPANKIVRVEYYNIPPARYADAGTLINVITKRMDTGINAGIEARTAITTGFTDDEAYLNLTSGNHQLSLSYSFSLRDYTKRFGELTYDYTLQSYLPGETSSSPVHYNYQEKTHDKFGYTWNDPVIKYTYNKPDNIAVQIVATPHFNNRHSDGKKDIQKISTLHTSEIGEGEDGSRMSTFGPNLNVYVQKTLPKNQELSIDLVGTYYHNSSKNWDEERSVSNGETWLSDNQEQQNNKYSFIGELAYTKKWEKNSLSLGYRGMFGRSNATISNVLSNYKDYDYSSASYQHYMYAEYSGNIDKLMYRIGAGVTQVTQDNTDAHDSHWLFTPKLILSTNLSKKMSLQWVTSSQSNTPPISQLSNNASLVIPGVLSIGNPYLKSYNTYQSELIHKWNLGWLQTQLGLYYTYTDSPINRYYTQQEINGEGRFLPRQQYIVGTNENANYSSELGGSYLLVVSPFKSQILTLILQGYVARQNVSSPIIGHYHHTWAPLYFALQFRKGNWGASYVGNIVSKRLNGSTLDAEENSSHLQVYWQKKNWRIFAADYWLFTRSRYSGYSMPTSILQSTYKTWIDDNKSMFILGFSYDFSTGKNLKINRKLQNKDSDTGSF
ncbi:MAG: TonB-dependent receptor [Prevotella sp.]|nr:TonB-dependent receptor [Prevotella sp.]